MSRENMELVRRSWEAFNRQDLDAWFADIDPDVCVYPRPDEPGVKQVYRGHDGLMAYLANWLSQWDRYEAEPLELIDAADRVLVVARERGRLEQQGIEVEQHFDHSFTISAGKIIEWRMYDSHAEALEDLGLEH